MSYRTKTGRLTKEGARQVLRSKVFAETFLTYAGNGEAAGEPYEIGGWLERNVWKPIFGTGKTNKARGRFERRFRRVLLGVHRGFGKSQFAAALILTIATMEEVREGLYGIVADTRENTKMIKGYIATMIHANSDLDRDWDVQKDQIVNRRTGQQILVFPYKEAALQGKHFNVLVGDEVHVWRDDSVWQAAVSGQGKVFNALTIGITTAGKSRDGFLFRLYRKLKTDSRAYVCWLGINDSDDPRDRRCWRKITAAGRITMAELEEQFEALTLDEFTRYLLNRTPMEEQEEPFMKRADVAAASRDSSTELDYGQWFCVGVDGAVSGDTLAVVAAQRVGERWAFKEWCWERPDPSKGVYDLTEVADVLQMLAAEPGAPLICADPARMQFLTNWLDRNRGIELTSVQQTPSIMCPASELLARAVRTRSCSMAGTPVLAKHCANAKSAESKAYGRRMTSERHGQGTRRIDAAIAAAMAMWAYDNNEEESPSAWSIDL